jgi:hypothetical protein
VFETVIPTERTAIWLKVYDGCLRILAPKHPGALVIAADELEFLTELVNASNNTKAQLVVPSLRVLFVDDCRLPEGFHEAERSQHATSGFEKWMVRLQHGDFFPLLNHALSIEPWICIYRTDGGSRYARRCLQLSDFQQCQ